MIHRDVSATSRTAVFIALLDIVLRFIIGDIEATASGTPSQQMTRPASRIASVTSGVVTRDVHNY